MDLLEDGDEVGAVVAIQACVEAGLQRPGLVEEVLETAAVHSGVGVSHQGRADVGEEAIELRTDACE
ncbi:hypothetical protein D3C72_2405290 [compost metagenome]